MLGQKTRNETLFTEGKERETPSVFAGMGLTRSSRWLRRGLLSLVVVIGAGMVGETAMAARKAPPIAQPM